MSSDNIAARNRANAQKSTGPKTAQGKAAVSQNALRHGATSKPDPTSVAAWLRIILDNPDLQSADFLKDDRRIAGALALAGAEVRLCSARAALDEFEAGEAPQSDSAQNLQNHAELLIDALRDGNMTARERRSCLSLLMRIQEMVVADTALDGKRHLLLRRYVREARGHRKRAFQAWLTCLRHVRDLAAEPA